jgi:hypothetical protein
VENLDMPIDAEEWKRIKRLAGRVFASSLHFTVATTNPDGTPHVVPIGSLILGQPGEAVFFEVFARRLARNLDRGSPVAVLGVISGRGFWLRSLIAGRFPAPPGFRLAGTAGARRPATDEETARWQRKLRLLRWTRGNALLWNNLTVVRELHFEELQPLRIGRMTSHFD